jgi:PPM family protein phosphatase
VSSGPAHQAVGRSTARRHDGHCLFSRHGAQSTGIVAERNLDARVPSARRAWHSRCSIARSGMAEIAYAQLTRAGAERGVNEDQVAHWRREDGLVFAIADGLGHEDAGREASGLAVEILGRELAEGPVEMPMLRRLRRAVQAINVELYHKRVTIPELRQMGSTLTVTAIVGSALVTAHVGDCRLWLLRGQTLVQLTKDHTWAWEQIESGVLSSEEARHHPRRYSLPRCLGHELIVSIDLLSMDVRAGDVLVHTSDGVHGALDDAEMRELLQAHPPEAACRAILRRAHESDADDDASVQVAVIDDVPPPPKSWWRLR